jgi:hypothetical protein
MKNLILLIFALLLSATGFSQVSFGVPELFNENWKFHKGDFPKAISAEFNDSDWRTVCLPHDWSVEGPLSPDFASANGYLPGGIAWYRKSFECEKIIPGKRYYIYFEGIYRNGEVFINGHSLGMRPEGFISYMYDMSDYIKKGGNIIAVKVDHSKYNDTRWYAGSGIYRDVYLITSGDIHFDQWSTFYTTTNLSSEKAEINIETVIKNHSVKPETVSALIEILDMKNKVVSVKQETITVPENGSISVNQIHNINNPLVWSVEKPNLYNLRTSILKNGKIIDKSLIQIGLRTIKFDANKGFFLNGQNTKIKGVCLHHDAGCLGSAVPKEVWRYRLEKLKEIGCNAIRTSHNPQAPDLYDLCDEIGLLVMDEAFDEWEFAKKKWVKGWNQGEPTMDGHSEFFYEWGEKDLRDMVLRDRNHPSVIMWSIGNEVDYPNDPYSHPILDKEGIQQQHTAGYQPTRPNAERLGGIAKKLASVVKKYDLSRPVTAGLAGPVMSNETEYPGALDICGYNYTERRYEQDHQKYPERVLYGSENGHDYDAWKYVRDKDYISGQFLWTGYDYLGEAHKWPSRGFGSGLFDLAGTKKPRAWFRQSLWSEQPVIYAGTYTKPRRSRSLSIDAMPFWNYKEGDSIRVVCYTNCDQAKLTLNNTQIGETKNIDNETGMIFWDIPFKSGKLEVKGINKGKDCSEYILETTSKPVAIKAFLPKVNTSSKYKTAIIEISIVDEKGRLVLNAYDKIKCEINGNATLLGIESGNQSDASDYKDNEQNVYQGKCVAYIKCNETKGKIKVTISSPSLKSTEIEIN